LIKDMPQNNYIYNPNKYINTGMLNDGLWLRLNLADRTMTGG